MSKICIVTISDGEIKNLEKTLKSIDSQIYKSYENIIIIKKKY